MIILLQILCGLVWLLVGILSPSAEAAGLVAFPGAEGFGAAAVGGRGGKVINVTNLEL